MERLNVIVLILICGLLCFVQQTILWENCRSDKLDQCHTDYFCQDYTRKRRCIKTPYNCKCVDCSSDSDCSTGQRCDIQDQHYSDHNCVLTDGSIAAIIVTVLSIIIISVTCYCYRKRKRERQKREQREQSEQNRVQWSDYRIQ